jgi:hypothetical protein
VTGFRAKRQNEALIRKVCERNCVQSAFSTGTRTWDFNGRNERGVGKHYQRDSSRYGGKDMEIGSNKCSR